MKKTKKSTKKSDDLAILFEKEPEVLHLSREDQIFFAEVILNPPN